MYGILILSSVIDSREIKFLIVVPDIYEIIAPKCVTSLRETNVMVIVLVYKVHF